MATWPPSIPQDFLVNGYRERPPKNTIRTQMDAGPDKVRRRATTKPRTISGVIELTRAQVETLDAFFRTDLEDGALRFDWVHPRTLAAVQFRFLEEPEYSPVSGATWTASLNLEVLP